MSNNNQPLEDLFQLGIKAIIQNQEGEILLLHHRPKKNIPDYWDIPGGRIEEGSTIEETLRREITEETGITQLTMVQMLGATVSNRRIALKNNSVGLILFVYLCLAKISDIKISEEFTEVGWFKPSKIIEPLKTKYPVEFIKEIISNL